MRRIVALAASAAAAATVLAAPAAFAAPPSSAGKCGAAASPIPHSVTPVSAGGTTFYIDNRGGLFVGGNGIWIYEETNGKGGLQRKAGNGSEAPLVGKTLDDNPATTSKDSCDDLQGATKADKLYF